MGSLGIDIGGTSIKVCLLEAKHAQNARSDLYDNPTRPQLVEAIKQAIRRLPSQADPSPSVGLCMPGRQARDGGSIERSVNLPCLNGWAFEELFVSVLGALPQRSRVMSDVRAAGEDFVCAHKLVGRVAVIAIGTGVGLAVFDDGEGVTIGDAGIGHLGMIDIGRVGIADVVAPDGSKNTLESYIGARAIERRFPDCPSSHLADRIATLGMDEPCMIALVRALRIVHAIYVPDQIVLLGGVGVAFEPLKCKIQSGMRDGLTSVANPDCSLMFGDGAYHAARGAARLGGG